LKECVRLYQHYLAGRPEYLSKDIPIAIAGGIPSIIPGSLRLEIKRRNVDVIKCVFTILSVYRVMKVPGTLKLNTITDPFKGLNESID
jgi:hypothetical protein